MSFARQVEIITEPWKCTGCRRCQLICSFIHKREFNLSKSYIVIVEDDNGTSSIHFTDDCDRCGVCVKYCVFASLKIGKEV